MRGQAMAGCRDCLGEGVEVDLEQRRQERCNAGDTVVTGTVVTVAGVRRGTVLAVLGGRFLLHVVPVVGHGARHGVVMGRRLLPMHLSEGAPQRCEPDQAHQEDAEPVFRRIRHHSYSMAAL